VQGDTATGCPQRAGHRRLGHLLQGLRRSDVDAVGVSDVLPKPVSYTTLIAAVERVIGPP